MNSNYANDQMPLGSNKNFHPKRSDVHSSGYQDGRQAKSSYNENVQSNYRPSLPNSIEEIEAIRIDDEQLSSLRGAVSDSQAQQFGNQIVKRNNAVDNTPDYNRVSNLTDEATRRMLTDKEQFGTFMI